MNVKEILDLHKKWLDNNPDGVRADLRGAYLSGADLSWANLGGANLSRANLSGADLRWANLGGANLRLADLRGANLRLADLRGADLRGADLRWADLRWANLGGADLRWANLGGANLRGANLSGANLSGATGLLNPSDFFAENFETSNIGYIVYKVFGGEYDPPEQWDIRPDAIIEEEVNYDRCTACACGINVATLDWIKSHYPKKQIWKCLIEWTWLAGVCVPYNTAGNIRASKVRLLEVVSQSKEC